ncbi:MAG: pyridoxamine 5'-phosphate oxidase family protein, partial [Cyclobacteriaceae bacterium]|nr:pyridoxamine 5'-phosphate oxidase family protein [Cyclobacteriaceae bacterium]
MLTEEIIPGLQGAIPSALATVDNDGIPNISYISQVFYVDENHVALSNQFFNKSMRNIKANGIATVNVVRPDNLNSWYMTLQYAETKTDGELFENMKMQLEAIASMMGMEDVFV